MNTRLQVEHPVTEAITGLDLVEWQFRVAAGETLPLDAGARCASTAMRSRRALYAEDPERGFLPSTGKLVALEFPPARACASIPASSGRRWSRPIYDPMIAKVIAHGADARRGARPARAARSSDTVVAGPHTNLGLSGGALPSAAISGRPASTPVSSIAISPRSTRRSARPDAGAVGAAVRSAAVPTARRAGRDTPGVDRGMRPTASQLGPARGCSISISSSTAHAAQGDRHVVSNGAQVSVDGVPAARRRADATAVDGGRCVYVLAAGRQTHVALTMLDTIDVDAARRRRRREGADARQGAGDLGRRRARVVTKGERVAVIEAMKMEHALLAPRRRDCERGRRGAGAQVAEGARILMPSKQEARVACRCISSSSASAATPFRTSRTGSSEQLAEEKKRGEKRERFHTHPHGAQARRRTARRRLALLGDPRRDAVPRAHPRHPCRSPTRTASAAAASCSTRKVDAGAAAAVPRLPGLALSRRPRTRRRTSTAPRPARATCRRRCGANCANLGLL